MNCGSTCYLNTTIACMGHCIPFLRFVLEIDKHDNSLIHELRDLLKDQWINEHFLRPKKFLNCIENNFKEMHIYEDNDMSEFVGFLIDKLNDNIATDFVFTNKNYSNDDYDIQRCKMDENWAKINAKCYSPLKEMFFGQTISQLLCGNCGKIFHNYETFSTTMVSINNETNLDECLRTYFEDEIKTDWKCDSCHTVSSSSKKTLKLWRIPEIFIISLKRFNHHKKDCRKILMPFELDVNEYSLSKTNTKYSLKAVGYHTGSTHNGHYYANVYHPDGNWYLMDDLRVQKITAPDVNTGYVYFYVYNS